MLKLTLKAPSPRARSLYIASTIALVFAAAHACGKTTKKNEDGVEIPETPGDNPAVSIEAQSSTVGILDISVRMQSDGLELSIANAPQGSSLECRLNEKPLSPCHDGALYSRPAAGDYKISVLALVNGTIVAVGESKTISVLPSGEIAKSPTDDDPMSVVLDRTDFRSGDTVQLGKELNLPLKLLGDPGCDAILMCSYDSRYTSFWTRCNESGKKAFIIPAEIMASGLQYLSVQARCADKVGPTLTLFWWGIPADYQPMMLRAVKDSKGRQIVNLVKSDDCPDEEQKLECADQGAEDYALCSGGNVFDNPKKGTRVRVTCGTRVGPALTL